MSTAWDEIMTWSPGLVPPLTASPCDWASSQHGSLTWLTFLHGSSGPKCCCSSEQGGSSMTFFGIQSWKWHSIIYDFVYWSRQSQDHLKSRKEKCSPTHSPWREYQRILEPCFKTTGFANGGAVFICLVESDLKLNGSIFSSGGWRNCTQKHVQARMSELFNWTAEAWTLNLQ